MKFNLYDLAYDKLKILNHKFRNLETLSEYSTNLGLYQDLDSFPNPKEFIYSEFQIFQIQNLIDIQISNLINKIFRFYKIVF
jgi:hypothetical protein